MSRSPYLPVASEEESEEIHHALLEFSDRGVPACLVEAVADQAWPRRAAAALVLGCRGTAKEKQLAKRLARDGVAEVRLRAAQGLLAGGDDAGLPTLVGLRSGTPLAIRWQAEELLRWAAGEGVGPGSRSRQPGLFLICQPCKGDADGSVWMCGHDGRPLWRIAGLRSPAEARLVAGPRVLIAESADGGVTERDPDGKVRWACRLLENPVECRRLDNGNTFIAELSSLDFPGFRQRDVTPDGKGESSLAFRSGFAYHMLRIVPLANGLVVASDKASFGGIDALAVSPPPGGKRRVLRFASSIEVRPLHGIEPVAGGGFLLSGTKSGEVLEVTLTGRIGWTHPLPGSAHATRLADGTTLIAAPGRVLRVNPAGLLVSEVLFDGDALRVRDCFGLLRVGFPTPPALDRNLDTLLAHRRHGLSSREAVVRRRTADLVGELGPDGVELIPQLRAVAEGGDEATRRSSAAALTRVGAEAFPAAVASTRHLDPKVRAKAIEQLSWYRRKADVVFPLMVAALRDEDPVVRSSAANYLPRLESRAGPAVVAIASLVGGESPDVELFAVDALRRLGRASRPAVPLLIRAFARKDQDNQNWIARCLGQVAPDDPAVIRAFLQGLEQGAGHRFGAAEGLFYCRGAAKEAVPALLRALDRPCTDGTDRVRSMLPSMYIHAIGCFGPDAKAAVQRLIPFVKGESEAERTSAIIALGQIGPAAKAALPAIEAARRKPIVTEQIIDEAIRAIRNE